MRFIVMVSFILISISRKFLPLILVHVHGVVVSVPALVATEGPDVHGHAHAVPTLDFSVPELEAGLPKVGRG